MNGVSVMKVLASKLRETFVSNGCQIEWFRVNEKSKRIEGKVVCGNDSLYVHVSPDVMKVWDGILSSDSERGAFAWGMREAWLHPQMMRPPKVLTDVPDGSVEKAYATIVEKPLHYQGGFYFIKGVMALIVLLSANGLLGLV